MSNIIIPKRCRTCQQPFKLSLDENSYNNWRAGGLIQNRFPELTPDLQELLISGVCGKCFDKMFAEEPNL